LSKWSPTTGTTFRGCDDRRTPTLVPVALTTLADVNFLPPA
jgi:hypothetical protein